MMRAFVLVGLVSILPTVAQAQISMFQPEPGASEYDSRPRVGRTLGQVLGADQLAFRHNNITLDCGCEYNTDPNKARVGTVNIKTCGYAPLVPSDKPIMARWGRILSLDTLAQGRACSIEQAQCREADGKALTPAQCCEKIDPEFQKMELDQWLWIPMISDIDAQRTGFRFQMSPSGFQPYGMCPLKIDPHSQTIEPVPKAKGAIARALLYFNKVWNVPLSGAELSTYAQWSAENPPDQNERDRAESIEEHQHFLNPFYH